MLIQWVFFLTPLDYTNVSKYFINQWTHKTAITTTTTTTTTTIITDKQHTCELNVPQVHHSGNYLPDVLLVIFAEAEDLHGSNHASKQLCISDGLPITVICDVTCHTVTLRGGKGGGGGGGGGGGRRERGGKKKILLLC